MQDSREHQLNVLIVDDEPTMRSLLVDIVSRDGHCAVPAESAEEILKLLPYWTFHVAFIDHYLPGMEGLVLGEYLRRNNANMTVALVTGDPDPRLEEKSRALEIEFIPKPLGVRDVLGVIERYKSAAELREEIRQAQQDDDFAPRFADHFDGLTAAFEIPSVPTRIEGRLLERIKAALNSLRSPHRYNERDRMIALSGLLTARVLGVRLPKTSTGKTLFEEYDQMMRLRSRREEFGEL